MKLCKMIQSRKGFTLVEIMVALSLLVVVIFGFTPVMLHGLTQIKDSGKGEAAVYVQQGEMEKQLAERKGLPDLPTTTVPVIFEKVFNDGASGGYSVQIDINGKALTGDGNMNLTTFFVDKDPVMTVMPSSVCDDMNIAKQPMTIHGDGIIFDDANKFKCYSMKNGEKQITSVRFKIEKEDIAAVTLSGEITMAGGPYEIRYGNAKAQFTVTPPALLIVGNNGAYIVSDGKLENSELTFQAKTDFPKQNLKAVAWNPVYERYEVVGDKFNGVKTNTPDKPLYSNSANSTWNHKEREQVIWRGEPSRLELLLLNGDWDVKDFAFLASDVDISAVGVLHSGEVMWGGNSRTNWAFKGKPLFGNWQDRTDGESFLFYQTPPFQDPVVTMPGAGKVQKILAGYNSVDQQEVDVVFGSFDNGVDYKVLNDGISYAIVGPGAVAAKSAAYGVDKQGEPLFKIVTNATIHSSTNGIKNATWTKDAIPENNKPTVLNDIAFGGDRWVAVGQGNHAIYSTDGKNWKSSNTMQSPSTSSSVYNSVTYTNGHFVAVGNGGLISYSVDGVNWKSTKKGTENLNGVAGQ